MALVNEEVPGQTMRFIVDDYATAGPPSEVKRAADRFSELTAGLGLMNHDGKQRLVRGRATDTALVEAGYEIGKIEVADGMIFGGQLIVDPLSRGGRQFVEDFYDCKLAGLRQSVARLRSLARRQDAFVIFSSCFLKRLDHLYFATPLHLNVQQLGGICERRDSILRDTVSWLVDEPTISGRSWPVVGLPLRHRGLGCETGIERALASGVTFAAEFARTGGIVAVGSPYSDSVGLYRDELQRRAPGVEDVLESQVTGRLLARLMAVVHDARACRLNDELPSIMVKQRSGLPQDGGFLQAIGTHESELFEDSTWIAMARQLLALPLLSSSNPSMESFGVNEPCLMCGALCLDPYGNHAMRCPSSLQTLMHTSAKTEIYNFVKAISFAHGSGVRRVEMEESGLVENGLRPGDVCFQQHGRQFTVDFFSVDSSVESHAGKCVEDLFAAAEDEKRAHYAAACADQDVTFFTFGMDVMGRLSESAEQFVRWMCNCVPDPVGGRARLVHYWSRRIVVASMKKKMELLLKRQCSASPGFSRVESLAKRLVPCDMLMPGGMRGYRSNRGRRRDVASFPCSVGVSVPGVVVGSG